MRPTITVLAICATVTAALPIPAAADCVDLYAMRKAAEAGGAEWINLPQSAWAFLRGIYVMHPQTAAGLPDGDSAVLAKSPGHDEGMVFFIDGPRACSHMPIPKQLLEVLDQVMTEQVPHEGKSL